MSLSVAINLASSNTSAAALIRCLSSPNAAVKSSLVKDRAALLSFSSSNIPRISLAPSTAPQPVLSSVACSP